MPSTEVTELQPIVNQDWLRNKGISNVATYDTAYLKSNFDVR